MVYRRLADARANLKHSVLSEWTVLLSTWFQAITVLMKKEVLFSVAMWHCVASVIVPDVVFHRVIRHKVCSSAGSNLATLLLGGQECICWHCWHQSLNHPVHESETQSFVPLMGSWEVMLVEEIHYKARCFGSLSPWL